MSRYAIKEGLLVVKGPENLRIVLDETGRRQFDSPLVAAVLDRITGGEADEDALVRRWPIAMLLRKSTMRY